ncbi:MAG: response regulator [Lewinellaceae bacterium]|nr:response regulator [Phaeodactylibacter sp.]MCB9039222.1 response regulator [Lewinellaceae bacterium]
MASRKPEGLTQWLQIAVADTGRGIPASQLDKIFNRFYQIDGSATRHGEGTGIGLTLTKELVKLLSGAISVESEIGEGTIFTVMLPITRDAEALDAKRSDSSAGAPVDTIGAIGRTTASTASTAPTYAGMPLRSTSIASIPLPLLLIIEDNADVVYYLSTILQGHYHLLTAPNGKAGLSLAQQEIPDIIVCDVMMPEMDGYETCRRLKGNLPTSHIPVILLTAKANFDSRLEGLERGADAYLAKPFEERELKATLKKLLENRERLRQFYTSGDFINRRGASPAGAVLPPTADHEFLQQFLAIVEANLSKPGFTAEQLSELLFMSYSTCLRKVKAATGKIPCVDCR